MSTRKRRPVVTEQILNGISDALARMESDDLTDISDEDDEAMRAAQEWVAAMRKHFLNK